MAIGNIETGNTSTLATFNNHLGFASLDKSNIPDILARI